MFLLKLELEALIPVVRKGKGEIVTRNQSHTHVWVLPAHARVGLRPFPASGLDAGVGVNPSFACLTLPTPIVPMAGLLGSEILFR